MRYGPDVIDAVLFDQGEPKGVLSVPEEELPRIGEAIRAGTGMEYQKASETEPGIYDLGPTPAASPATREYDLDESCTIDRPRPCELTVGLGRIADLAGEAGASAEEILALEARGETTEAEAEAAARAVIARIPCGGPRYEAEIWYEAVGNAPDVAKPWSPLPPSSCPNPPVEKGA